MHGLVRAAARRPPPPRRRDRDRGRPRRRGADQAHLRRRGGLGAWIRPGFDLGRRLARLQREQPELRGVVLGGHGLTAWGTGSEECQATSLELIGRAAEYIATHGDAEPFGPVAEGFAALPEQERLERAAVLAPVIRGLCSTDGPVVGHCGRQRRVLDFIARREAPARRRRWGRRAPTTSSAPRCDRCCWTCGDRTGRGADRAPARAARRVPRGVPRLLRAPRDGRHAADARRRPGHRAGARRRDVQLRRRLPDRAHRRRVLRQRDQRDASAPRRSRRTSRSPRRRSSASSTGSLEEAKLQRRPQAQAARPAGSRSSPAAASGIGRAIAQRLRAEGAAVVVADLDLDGRRASPTSWAARDHAVAVAGRRRATRPRSQALIAAAVARFGGVDIVVNNAGLSSSAPLLETTVDDWDLQHASWRAARSSSAETPPRR